MSEALKGPLYPRVADTEGRLPFGLPLELTVNDPDTIRELLTFHEGEPRERYALNALRIGVLAEAGAGPDRRRPRSPRE